MKTGEFVTEIEEYFVKKFGVRPTVQLQPEEEVIEAIGLGHEERRVYKGHTVQILAEIKLDEV